MKENEEALTAERLRKLLDYSPETGEFRWRFGRRGVSAARVTWSPDSYGYYQISVDGRTYKAHRLAWLYVHGAWPPDQIDHINGIRGDNRIVNLREATRAENQGNQRKARSDNKTGLLGVFRAGGSSKFRAQICLRGNKLHIGYFSTAEEAHQAYLAAKRELHTFCTL